MPSEADYVVEVDTCVENSFRKFFCGDLDMESQNNYDQFSTATDADVAVDLLPLSPSDGSRDQSIDPFTKPTSAQLDFSGLTTQPTVPNLAFQLDHFDSFHDSVSSFGEDEKEPLKRIERQLLVNIPDEGTSLSSISPVSSPCSSEIWSPSHSGITSPETLFHDPNTQLSLIHHAEDLTLNSEASHLDSDNVRIPSFVQKDTEVPRKVQKTEKESDAPSTSVAEDTSSTKQFDPASAISSSQFIFTQFGTGVSGVFTISTPAVPTISSTNTSTSLSARPLPVPTLQPPKRLKQPSLKLSFPSKSHGIELKINSQPEEHHRARYLTEGSRGAVKDASGQGHPEIQLLGYNQQAILQTFVGNDAGSVKPHGFYQACKVCGKSSTQCVEKEIDGTKVIEMEFNPEEDMKVSIDCVGILKLRNADVEQRIGVARSKKKSTKARLVFRVCLPKADGSTLTLQVASSQILCTQPIGQPEISKKSLHEGLVTGGDELFIIGKNFMKGTKVLFQETADETTTLWEKAAEIDGEFFQQTHMICRVPQYDRQKISEPLSVRVVIDCCGRVSEPQPFTYNPVANEGPPSPVIRIKEEKVLPMETNEVDSTTSKSLNFISPEARELNKMIQDQQQDGGIFKIPPGVDLGLPTKTEIAAADSAGCCNSSAPSVTQDTRAISSMDTSSSCHMSLTQSSLMENAPTLVSLLVEEPAVIRQASQAIDELVSNHQKADALKSAATSSTQDVGLQLLSDATENGVLPSISFDDIVDVLQSGSA